MNRAYAQGEASGPPGVDVVTIAEFLSNLVGGNLVEWALSVFEAVWPVYVVVAYLLSAIMGALIIYAMIRSEQVSEELQEVVRQEEHAYKHAYGKNAEDSKWNNVLAHVESENPNDWRLAIIEADIMLGDMLTDLGYVGTSIGEQLKTANAETFQTLNDAWEAHKVRNHVAHTGADFVLTKRLAKETIHRYARVFEEFDVT